MEIETPTSAIIRTSKILIIDACNFENYPLGGTLSFARQMMGAFKDQLVLVGISTDKDIPVGKWIVKEIEGVKYDFFAIRRAKITVKKPFIPDRIKNYIAMKYYKTKIKAHPLLISNVFIQSPETLLAVKNWKYKNVCFRSPGVVNMLIASRFWYAKYFAKISDYFLYRALSRVNVILASADKFAINNFVQRSNNHLDKKKVIQFPTRINTSIFRPLDKNHCRSVLNLDNNSIVIVSTGRLSSFKGWKFMIDCFYEFNKRISNSKFFLLGDGEDRQKVAEYIKQLNIEKAVFISGSIKQEIIANYLNASDLYIMGSYIEGWSTSLLEAVACMKPVCVTNFGSALDMVENGKNGYVVLNHNQPEFIEKMFLSLNLAKHNLAEKSVHFSEYSLNNFRNSITFHWKLV